MAILDDAVALVCWYESQPDCGTYKKDRRIAETLGWFVGGITRPPSHTNVMNRPVQPDGDAGRVRAARRYVDTHNDFQPFLGYSFGTKQNGSGVRFSALFTPQMANSVDAVNESTSEQIGRVVQGHAQALKERARQIGHLNEAEARFIAAGQLDKALVVHDAAKELQMFGTITLHTLQEMRRLGITEKEYPA